jgi:hypothetical protein
MYSQTVVKTIEYGQEDVVRITCLFKDLLFVKTTMTRVQQV